MARFEAPEQGASRNSENSCAAVAPRDLISDRELNGSQRLCAVRRCSVDNSRFSAHKQANFCKTYWFCLT